MIVAPLKYPHLVKLCNVKTGTLVEIYDEHLVSQGFFITMEQHQSIPGRNVFSIKDNDIIGLHPSTRCYAFRGAAIVTDYTEGA